jgi:hypothetical protein
MNRFNKTLRLTAVLAVFGATTACDTLDDLLEVSNPERIAEEDLDDALLVNVLTNSVIGAFSSVYDDPFLWRGSMFTDEQITGINWESTARLSQRLVRYDEGDADNMFSAISAARAMGDSVSGRFRTLLESPSSDERMATTLIYAGYSHIIMGDAMCEAVFDVGETIASQAQIYERGVARFEEGLQVAAAAGRGDLVNLARVGLARTHLNLGNASQVMQYASEVPADFAHWVEYEQTSGGTDMVLWGRINGGNHSLGVHPNFLNGEFGTQDIINGQTDPRVQHTTSWSLGHNRLTQLYKPYQSLPFSGFNGEAIADGGSPPFYERGTDIKMASGLEAMHHLYEAAGPDGMGPAGSTLDFVNARRAFGKQDPVDLSGADLMAELRDQRGRDMYLGGFRLGDLRRWMNQGAGNFFPQGTHPTTEWGSYGDATCFPLPLEEYEGNPNLTKPG